MRLRENGIKYGQPLLSYEFHIKYEKNIFWG